MVCKGDSCFVFFDGGELGWKKSVGFAGVVAVVN